jgi:hypothetical protein
MERREKEKKQILLRLSQQKFSAFDRFFLST